MNYFNNNYTNIPVIIGGNFNDEPQNSPISEIMNSNF